MRRGLLVVCLLWGCSLVSEFPESRERSLPDAEAPLVAYDFDELRDGSFPDVGRFGAYPLTPQGDVEAEGGGVAIGGSAYLLSPPVTGFNVGVTQSNAFALSMWVETADISQGDTGDPGLNARIVNVSEDHFLRNVTIAQWVDGLIVRVRRDVDEEDRLYLNGRPEFRVLGVFDDTNIHHHVLQVSERVLQYWVDGELVLTEILEGDLTGWNEDYVLTVGNEAVGERPWAGTMHDLRLYDDVFEADEIREAYAAGPP